MAERETDALSGTETTGHEWDGIKELNTPLPRWWLYTFYVCIVWAIGYFILYPAWPSFTAYTKGVLGYSSRGELAQTMDAVRASRAGWVAKFQSTDVAGIKADEELLQYAMAGGRIIFAENCASCHGAGGSGAPAYPVLADDDWLWGGTPQDIYTTVRFGIRSGHEKMRDSQMPAFGRDGILNKDQIVAVADHVMSLSGQGSANAAGAEVFKTNCVACHGEDGKGLREFGAPNLTDGIWLYAGTRDAIVSQVTTPRHGVMPAWTGRLDDVAIKQVTIYVHSLGGGQ